MGIYPKTDIEGRQRHRDGTETWTEVYNDFSGVIRRRKVTAEAWVDDERIDCFCCSCDEWGSDPHCRNHGWAGQRPCDVHKMPGAPYEDEEMPESVQAHNAKRKGEAK